MSMSEFGMSASRDLRSSPLRILLAATEVVPFAKVSGPADVAGSLPCALKALGYDVRVVMPRYGRINPHKFGLHPVVNQLDVPMDNHTEPVTIWQGAIGSEDDASSVPVYFVDSPRYFDRDGIYSYPDDDERFVLFCRAALEMLKPLDWQPDVIHCHEWHTAIIPNILKSSYSTDPFFRDIATVYTIHNLAYQGIFGHRVLEIAGIGEYGFVFLPQNDEGREVVSLMERGIRYADAISTVSERYAQEILTPEYGERLDPLLNERRDRLFGILNGIDTDLFNPATDKFISTQYDVARLDAREQNKADLQHEFNLPQRPDVPVIAMISRFANQKGFDILAQIIEQMLQYDVQFILLGTGDPYYHEIFGGIAQRYPDKAAVSLTFTTVLSQKIFAGADMYLMPSRFEPCGLNQMIAMRYGAIPVVHKTGGLADTVKDFDPRTQSGNGFVFEEYDPALLLNTIVRACDTYRHQSVWRDLMVRAMQADYSWDASARKYGDLYHKAVEFHTKTPLPT